jgi:hypothetical protein
MFTEFLGELASYANIVPASDTMTIIPMMDVGPVPLPAGPPYFTQFAPDKHQQTEKQNLPRRLAQGEKDPEAFFAGSEGEDFDFNILIDGTGAAGSKREVLVDVELLKVVTGFNGILHHPNYLLVVWGTFIRTAILKDFSVSYELFRPDGTPLRAKVKLVFRKHVPKIQSLLESRLSSPDMTQQRIFRAGDRLDLLCNRHYRDQRYHIAVAKVNGLTSFRFLKQGQEIVLPPIEK